MRRRRGLLVRLGALACGLACSELLLHGVVWVSPTARALFLPPWRQDLVREPPSLQDAVLGSRPNPRFPGHDGRGFRNQGALSEASVVVFGDSQTYGLGVQRHETWPSRLQELAGGHIYNMAFLGWGPTHSLALWDDAVRMNPQVVLQAVYSGNDLYDSFAMIYRRDQFAELREQSGRIAAAVGAADSIETLEQRIARTFPGNPKFGSLPETSASRDRAAQRVESTLDGIKNSSRIYGLIRRMRWTLSNLWRGVEDEEAMWRRQMAFASNHADVVDIFERGEVRTLFTPAYRLTALDQGDPRIREGTRVSLSALGLMNKLAGISHIRFVVVLIPTKEFVFRRLVEHPTSSYERLIEQESSFWRSTKEFLERGKIEYVDALPALEAAVEKGVEPYPITWDGHPNALGHLAIARRVAASLGQDDRKY